MISSRPEGIGGGSGVSTGAGRISMRLSARVRSGSKGLKTTTGQSRAKISKIEARRIAEQAAGPKAKSMGGNKPLKATAPKPDVRVTTRTGNPKKDTVTKPVKRTLNKRSAVTIKKTTPRKPAEVRAEREKARRDRLRTALTPTQNPARIKAKAQRDPKGGADRTDARKENIIERYYKIRFGDRSGPEARGGKAEPRTIDQRIEQGVEKAPRSSKPSTADREADARVNEALNPKSRVKATVKPGKPTKTTVVLRTVGGNRGTQNAKLKGAIRNQRKVLRQREIDAIVKRAEKAGN